MTDSNDNRRFTLYVRTDTTRYPLDDEDLREFRDKFGDKVKIEQRPLYLGYIGVSDVVYIILNVASPFAIAVAAQLLSRWLWERLESRGAVVAVFDPERPKVPPVPIQSERDLEREMLKVIMEHKE